MDVYGIDHILEVCRIYGGDHIWHLDAFGNQCIFQLNIMCLAKLSDHIEICTY
jgi:hypothetical protein